MSNNIFPVAMRETGTDYETGWTRDGLWERRYPVPSSGVMGLSGLGDAEVATLKRIPRKGREYVLHALNDRDPEVRRIATECLTASDPEECLARQAEADVAEAINPTGKRIVFKGVAAEVAPQARAIENALLRATPGQPGEHAAIAKAIVDTSDDPGAALEEFYSAVAIQAVTGAPLDDIIMGGESFDEGMSGLGFFADLGKKRRSALSKLWLKVRKPLAITAIVAASAAAIYFGGPVVLPALGSVLKGAGGAIGGGIGAIFGRGRAQAQPSYDAQQAAVQQQQAAYFQQQAQIAAAQGNAAQASQFQQEADYYRQQAQATQAAPQEGPPAPGPSALDSIINVAASVLGAKKAAASGTGSVQSYQIQREQLITRIMQETHVSRSEAERLADQTLSQMEGGSTSAGMFGGTGMMLPVIIIGGIAVVLSAKGGRGR